MILTVVMDRMAAVLRRCLPLRAAGAAVCAAAMACVAGCGDAPLTDDGGMSSGVVRPSVREYRAEFRIVLEGGDAGKGSRAPETGAYDPGSAAENHIDIAGGDFRILIFDSNDLYLGSLDDVGFIPVDPEGASKTYYLLGSLDPEMMERCGRTFKVMFLANWSGGYMDPEDLVAGKTTVAELCAASVYAFDPASDLTLDGGRLIPMFGITDLYRDVDFGDYGSYKNLGAIHLLRAYAKVEVRGDGDSPRIKSVVLTRCNKGGFRAPQGISSQSQYVHGDYDLDYIAAPSVPGGQSVAENVALVESAEGVWTAYVPEYRILDKVSGEPLGEDERARIVVVYDEKVEVEHFVDFKYYGDPPVYAPSASKGDYFNIVRNNWYRFTLSKDPYRDPDVEVDVMPYASVELKPDYGMSRDEATGWIVIRKYAPEVYYYDDIYNRYYDADKKHVPLRVERTAGGLMVERDRVTNGVRYAYDPVTDKYYVDAEGKTPLTSVTQLKFDRNHEGLLLIRYDDEGNVIYFYDEVAGRWLDENGSVVPPVNFGIHKDLLNKYLVVEQTPEGNPVFFYDIDSDRYFDKSLNAVDAFPPKN